MTRYCAYCGNLIEGKARPVPDYADRGAHARAYWHANQVECGRRTPRTTTPDSRPEPLRRYAPRPLWPRSS